MKRIKTLSIAAICIYLFFAFIYLQLNPSNWDQGARIGASVIFVIVAFVTWIIENFDKIEKA